MKQLVLNAVIPVNENYDVIVAGGGPAGCSAAISAARAGARTLLLEATGCLGGMGTSGMVPAWCPFSDHEQVIYKGIAQEIFEASKRGVSHVRPEDTEWVPIDAERLKRVYDEMVVSSGADILFHTVLSKVETDGQGRVTAVVVTNKAGMTAYTAPVYVDCTGDADLAAWAGAEFQKGSENSGDLQPATHCFVMSGVNEYAFRFGPELHPQNPSSPVYSMVASGRYPEIPDVHLCNNLVGPASVGFNAGHIWGVDNTDPVSLSRGLIAGRRMAEAFSRALAEFHPGAFAGAYLASTGSMLGIRETRRIVGDYCLTGDDYTARRSFEDEICRNSYFIDIHTAKEEAEAWNNKSFDIEKRFARYGKGESHGVPYRCLTPRSLKNVLVAGRSVSADRPMQGSVRVMPVCLAMGEAAGLAAAMVAGEKTPDVHQLDVQALRSKLRENGAYLP